MITSSFFIVDVFVMLLAWVVFPQNQAQLQPQRSYNDVIFSIYKNAL